MSDNYPAGYREYYPEEPFPMPEANEEDDARLALYNEYATPEQSLETFCDETADRLGDKWIYLLSRKSR